jgi:hypothetical protein
MDLILISAGIFVLVSIIIVIVALVNENKVVILIDPVKPALISLNYGGLNAKKHLLGLVKYIKIAEKDRIIF